MKYVGRIALVLVSCWGLSAYKVVPAKPAVSPIATAHGVLRDKVGPAITIAVEVDGKVFHPTGGEVISMDVNKTAIIRMTAQSPISGHGVGDTALIVAGHGEKALSCRMENGRLVGGTTGTGISSHFSVDNLQNPYRKAKGKTISFLTLEFQPKGAKCIWGGQMDLLGLPIADLLNMLLWGFTVTAEAQTADHIRLSTRSFQIKGTGLPLPPPN